MARQPRPADTTAPKPEPTPDEAPAEQQPQGTGPAEPPKIERPTPRERTAPPPPPYFTAMAVDPNKDRVYMARSDGKLFYKKGSTLTEVALTIAPSNAD